MLLYLYAYRSFRARLRANLVVVLSVAMFVVGASQGIAFYLGLKHVLASSTSPENILVLANGASSEVDSDINLDTANRISVLPGIKRDGNVPLAARELVSDVQLDAPEVGSYEEPVSIRGIDAVSMTVHQINMVAGSPPQKGSLDVMLGRRVAEKYPQLQIGQELHLPGGACRISGVFAENGGPFEDEVWTERAALELHLHTKHTNSMTIAAEDVARVPQLVNTIKTSKDLNAQAAPVAVYREKNAGLSSIAKTVLVLVVFLIIVATIAITTTMNAEVSARMAELAALAAIGIRRASLARLIIVQSAFTGAIGAIAGVLITVLLGGRLSSVLGGGLPIDSSLSAVIAGIGVLAATIVGLIGGSLPALRVRRLNILRTLGAGA